LKIAELRHFDFAFFDFELPIGFQSQNDPMAQSLNKKAAISGRLLL
jgi:hypothetical protein